MELWIRSQDKENLVKTINQIGLHYANNNMIIANYQPDFIGTQGEYYETLGTYKTKERALEVLDEIQRLITPEINYNPVIKREMKPEDTYARTTFERYETTIESLPCYVYEMPKE